MPQMWKMTQTEDKYSSRRRIIARSLGKAFFTFVNAGIREGCSRCTRNIAITAATCIYMALHLHHISFITIHHLSNVEIIVDIKKIIYE